MSSRPEYRDSKTPRAVKVYSVAQESRHIIISNVPALGLSENLLKQCSLYGAVEEIRSLDDHASVEEFTKVYYLRLGTVDAARRLKQAMDDRPFYSNLLTIAYAPYYETVHDARLKLQNRRNAIHQKLSPVPRSSVKKRPLPQPSYGSLSPDDPQQQKSVWRAHALHEPSSQVTSTVRECIQAAATLPAAPIPEKKKRRRI